MRESSNPDFTEIENELNWLAELLIERGNNPEAKPAEMLTGCPALNGNSAYGKLCRHFDLSVSERAIFILAIAPHISPEIPDILIRENTENGISYSETGGRKGNYQNGNLPTVQTALFMLAGRNIAERIAAMKYLSPGSRLSQADLVRIIFPDNAEPNTAGLIQVPEYVLQELTGCLLKRKEDLPT